MTAVWLHGLENAIRLLLQVQQKVQQDEQFHIDFPAAENLPLLGQRIGRDPHAVLEVTEAFVAHVASQPFALGVLARGHAEEHEPPPAIFRSHLASLPGLVIFLVP